MKEPPCSWAWAKTTANGSPGCSVWEHGMTTAEVARLLLELLPQGFRNRLPAGLLPLIALHDIGKISPGFQTKCTQWKGVDGRADERTLRNWSKCESSHAAVSQWLLGKYFRRTHRCTSQRPWLPWAECAGAHHGRYAKTIRANNPFDTPPLDDIWQSYAADFIQNVLSTLGPLPEHPLEKDETAIQEWIIGLTEVADWIASNENFFPPEGGLSNEDIPSKAKRALASIGFTPEAPVARGRSWEELFPHAPNPRPLQRHLWNHSPEPGIYIVEDSMGGGKTEAALGLAYHLMEKGVAGGLYFALPTQTTSNRIFERVLDFLANAGAGVDAHNLRLAHGNSWLVQDDIFRGWNETAGTGRVFPEHCGSGNAEDSAAPVARNWFASSRRALLSRFGVGTIDQALMGELNVKHCFVRRYALSGKVVILDEVHSYDMYTGTLMKELVHNLRKVGSTVILLSATLTRARRAELLGAQAVDSQAYPLCSIAEEDKKKPVETPFPAEQREVRVSCRSLDMPTAVKKACERARQGQCVLWIRNTVQEAQDAYKQLKAERCEGDPDLGLLHARFPLWRRQELEDLWIKRLGRDGSRRPPGCILVATQVAEQSLDIDADFLITDLAPTDMLLQRAGRLWRHARPRSIRHAETAEMLILTPDLPSDAPTATLRDALNPSGCVYAPYVLLRSHEVWRAVETLRLPSDIRPLLEKTYAEREEEAGTALGEFLNELEKKKKEMRYCAIDQADKKAPFVNDTDDVSARYNSRPTVDLLLLKEQPEEVKSTITRYVPLHGAPFEVDTLHWDARAARAIRENLVRVPRDWAPASNGASDIANYGFSVVRPMFPIDTSTQSTYNLPVRWDPELGVYLQHPLDSAF